MKKLIVFCAILLFPAFLFSENKCSDTLVYYGSDNVAGMGMDSTGHYWIVTVDGLGYKSLIIDAVQVGKFQDVNNLTFSRDGRRWACFVRSNVSWSLLTNDETISMFCDTILSLGFSGNSQVLYYSYIIGSEVNFIVGERKIRGFNATGDFFVSQGGERFALMGYRGTTMVLTINGWETQSFDEIRPFGFMYDGSFLFAGRSGNMWEIYRDKKSITEPLISVKDLRINGDGTVAAFLAKRSQAQAVAMMICDDYTEPMVSKSYDAVEGLAIHPNIPLIAFKASYNSSQYIVLSNTEYSGGETTGTPHFSYDGSQLYFAGCATDCFINIDGQRFNLYSMFNMMDNFAMKPHSQTIAYSSSSALVVRFLGTKNLHAGRMVDQIIDPMYNWRTDEYRTLGIINNRVYLMKCRV